MKTISGPNGKNSKRFLVDSNVLIDYLRGDETVANFGLSLIENKNEVFISVITLYEILCGKDITSSKEKKEKVEKILYLFPILEINTTTAQTGALLYKKYQLGIADALIAANALNHNCTLITRNTKHFSRIKEIEIKIP